MVAPEAVVRPSRSASIGLIAVFGLVALTYGVLIGGTAPGEVQPTVQLVNLALLAPVIALYAWRVGSVGDRMDYLLVVSLLLYASAGMLSTYPRQSLDAVLGLVAFVSVLFAARSVLARPGVRRAFLVTLMALSTLVTASIAASWGSLAAEWMALTGWRVLPPLNMELPGGLWGHRHDAALLVLMLYPAWWMNRPGILRRALAIVVGLVVIAIVVLDGSRTLWIASALSGVIVTAPRITALASQRGQSPLMKPLVLVVLVAGGLLASGAVADRLTNLSSLGFRFEMWSAMISGWLDRPIVGQGPGSFPWLLQSTGYFDLSFWAPRHADSVPVQTLVESGVVGLVALGTGLAAVAAAVVKGRSTGALWALLVFCIACLAADPANFPYMLLVVAGWVAYATPHMSDAAPSVGASWRPRAAIACLAVVAIAQASLLTGSFAFAEARTAIRDEDYGAAERALQSAIARDPGMAMYRRELGLLHLAESDLQEAVATLETAAALNPADDVAWRLLTLARLHEGDVTAALASAERAVDVQRSDPMNLLLLASIAAQAEGPAAGLPYAAEVLQGWPSIAGSIGWEPWLSGLGFAAAEVVDAAAERELRGAPTPLGDVALLSELAGRAVSPEPVDPLDRLRWASYGCGLEVPPTDQVPDAWVRSGGYWDARARAAALAGMADKDAVRILEIMSGVPIRPVDSHGTVDVTAQHDVPVPVGSDLWGYRRLPVEWTYTTAEVPSPAAGTATWLLDPDAARRNSGLPECLPASGHLEQVEGASD